MNVHVQIQQSRFMITIEAFQEGS